MAEAGVLPGSRSERVLGGLKTTAGIVAAVAGAVTGMWGIYEKVKSDARQYTTASYETLAPQLNQMTEALRKIEQENQQLKQALLARTRPTRPAKAGSSGARSTPAATPVGPAAPGTPASAEPAAPTAGATPEEKEQGALDRILGTMHQTKEAVDAVRKVPESFKQVLEQKKK